MRPDKKAAKFPAPPEFKMREQLQITLKQSRLRKCRRWMLSIARSARVEPLRGAQARNLFAHAKITLREGMILISQPHADAGIGAVEGKV